MRSKTGVHLREPFLSRYEAHWYIWLKFCRCNARQLQIDCYV